MQNYTANPSRVLIVAEFTNNHLGDPAKLLEMADRAREAGADLIKIQKRDVESFYTAEQLVSKYDSPFGTTLGDYRRGVELSKDTLHEFSEYCNQLGIDWFASVLDYKSYTDLKPFNPKLIKIPSTISNHHTYMKRLAAEYSGPIVVSTGLTTASYLDHIFETFWNNPLWLLHCVSAYPTPREHCNINVVRYYDQICVDTVIPGYSSHDSGSIGSMLAVAAGARMIEKHVKLEDNSWIHFDNVALGLKNGEFAKFVQDIRTAEKMMGSSSKRILECEHHKYGHEIQ